MRWFQHRDKYFLLCSILLIHAQLCKAIEKQAVLGEVAPELHELVNTISGVIERIDK